MFYTHIENKWVTYYDGEYFNSYIFKKSGIKEFNWRSSQHSLGRFRPSTPEEIELIKTAFPGKFKTNKIELW